MYGAGGQVQVLYGALRCIAVAFGESAGAFRGILPTGHADRRGFASAFSLRQSR